MAAQQQWGRYPDSQGSQGLRDEYDDYTYPMHENRRSFDAQPPRRSRSNRASVQTSNTDALTESTFSPHSPTASSFAGAVHGLAPRPPSYQRPVFVAPSALGSAPGVVRFEGVDGVGQPAFASVPVPSVAASNRSQELVSHMSDGMSRRPDRQSSEQYRDSSFESVPQASLNGPDPSRGPPPSYRQPHGNSGPPYAGSSSNSNSNSGSNHPSPSSKQLKSSPLGRLAVDDDMDPEGYYTTRREEYSDVPRHRIHDVTSGRGSMAPPIIPQDIAARLPRKTYVNVSSGRRNQIANDRSPLQRLELTLDSMTKEEKRARVQAAEQRARERAARRAAEASGALPIEPPKDRRMPMPIESHNLQNYRPEPIAAAVPVAKPQSHRPESYSRDPQAYPQHQPARYQQQPPSRFPNDAPERGYVSGPPPEVQAPPEPQREREEDAESRSALPKRNLSFRERAAKNERDLPAAQASPVSPPTAFFTGGPTTGMSLTRSGSNKLRKEPPAEQLAPSRPYTEKEAPSATIPKQRAATQAYAAPSRIPRAARDKELPPVPVAQEPTQGMQRRATEPIYGKEYGSDEEYVPQATRAIPAAVPVPIQNLDSEQEGTAAARRRLERQDSDHSVESAPDHRVSNLIFKDPENLHPGEGLYKPPVWLDEYKKATVGSLGGTLLDLTDNHGAGADKGKAWWENGGSRKSSTYSSRPRKAEAFDGEYDDTNGKREFEKEHHRQEPVLT